MQVVQPVMFQWEEFDAARGIKIVDALMKDWQREGRCVELVTDMEFKLFEELPEAMGVVEFFMETWVICEFSKGKKDGRCLWVRQEWDGGIVVIKECWFKEDRLCGPFKFWSDTMETLFEAEFDEDGELVFFGFEMSPGFVGVPLDEEEMRELDTEIEIRSRW